MKQDWIVGKGVIVIGGVFGIGWGIVLEVGKMGVKVIVVDLNVEMGQEIVEMIEVEGGQVFFIFIDVIDSWLLVIFVIQAVVYVLVCYLVNLVGL